jgi:hypothetical protein
MAEQPDAPYYLVQTVLIQDMALRNAESRIAELERQLAQAKAAAAAPQQQPQSSFLAGAGRGSVPSAGAWTHSPPSAAPAPAWSQSGGASAPATGAAPVASSASAGGAPTLMPGAGSGFLRQAATTAAGIAGGALLFQGIQSLFGPHYGGGFLSGMPTQPGISETVNNYYYEDQGGNAPDTTQADAGADRDQSYAADQDLADTDFADQDLGSDDSNFDV